MTDFVPESRLSPKPAVVFRELEGEAVLLDTARGVYFSLNETGALLWQALGEGGSSLGQLHLDLQRAFDVPAARLWQDLLDWAQQLEESELVTVALEDGRESQRSPLPR